MPADHASGRFALGLNGLSRKIFPLGATAALSLIISTAAHADRCVLRIDAGGAPVSKITVQTPAPKSCVMLARASMTDAFDERADPGPLACGSGRAEFNLTIRDVMLVLTPPPPQAAQ